MTDTMPGPAGNSDRLRVAYDSDNEQWDEIEAGRFKYRSDDGDGDELSLSELEECYGIRTVEYVPAGNAPGGIPGTGKPKDWLEEGERVTAHRLDRIGSVVVGALMPYDESKGERVIDASGAVWRVNADSVRPCPTAAPAGDSAVPDQKALRAAVDQVMEWCADAANHHHGYGPIGAVVNHDLAAAYEHLAGVVEASATSPAAPTDETVERGAEAIHDRLCGCDDWEVCTVTDPNVCRDAASAALDAMKETR